ncbi:hypothetical protein WN48_03079 [Eufriesea mexicana]|nr:hypothetical protein WN48_03079 [Eufriesea mexicana]
MLHTRLDAVFCIASRSRRFDDWWLATTVFGIGRKRLENSSDGSTKESLRAGGAAGCGETATLAGRANRAQPIGKRLASVLGESAKSQRNKRSSEELKGEERLGREEDGDATVVYGEDKTESKGAARVAEEVGWHGEEEESEWTRSGFVGWTKSTAKITEPGTDDEKGEGGGHGYLERTSMECLPFLIFLRA